MKPKVSIPAAIAMLVLLLGAGAVVYALKCSDTSPRSESAAPATKPGLPQLPTAIVKPAPQQPVRDPLPGQGRPVLEAVSGAGVLSGRVINWSTGDGVVGAELTFQGDGGATTIQSRADGVFELAPAAPGSFTLITVTRAGFLPFAPELLHSSVRVKLTNERAVRGVTVFLFPALDYQGRVVDATGAPVAGARVRLLGTPTGEQILDKLETEWTTDKTGSFTFHAADDAVFEAVRGNARGWATLDGSVAITHRLLITIRDAAVHDATITGRVIDGSGAPIADAQVRALPSDRGPRSAAVRAPAFATTGADGAFTLDNLDRGEYDLAAEHEGRAPATRNGVVGGTRGVTLTLDAGLLIAGVVESTDGSPIPAYTLLVMRREGAVRDVVLARSIVDAAGRFEVRVGPGDYQLLAAASGWAPSKPVAAAAGARDVKLVVTVGATLRGTVLTADGRGPIPYARIMREAVSGGASAQPANAGTVTRPDGTFELTGIPPGLVSITIDAAGFHPKIEAGMTASDGGALGPLTITLQRLAEGEQPSTELVGIGVQLAADADTLRVDRVIAGGGAAAAGIVAGDHVLAIDGVSISELGMDGAVAKIRGVVGTTVSVTLRRDEAPVTLVVERRKLRT